MLYAAVAWTSTGYQVSVVDPAGRPVTRPASYGAADVDAVLAELCELQRRSGRPVVLVFDSTNGMLDGRALAAGLAVRRADPWLLRGDGAAGGDGATAAGADGGAAWLAACAARDPAALVEVTPAGGTLTGRLDEVDAGIAAGATAEAELTAAGRCLRHGRRDAPTVALTFDDGPLPPYTGRVLEILDRYAVPATFFCVGFQATAFPDEVRRIAGAGHTVANHTWSHPFLPDLTAGQLAEQLDRTVERLAGITGTAPRLFRPPYGSRNAEILSWLAGRDETVVLWDVEAFDWSRPGPEAIAAGILAGARPGSIVLLHDGGGDRDQTVAALPTVIEGLLTAGYRIVPVDQLTAASHHQQTEVPS